MSQLSVIFIVSYLAAFGGYAQDLTKAKLIYERQCGRCHGIKGGGGTGPSLARPYLSRAPDDVALTRIVQQGIAGTGMPGSGFLDAAEVTEIVKYVRFLGQTTKEEITGDPVLGKEVFNRSDCNSCHIINGVGGSLGPELTLVGQKRGVTYLKGAIQHPGMDKPVDQLGYIEYLVVTARLNDGSEISGVRLNEDTFTLQLKDINNRMHSIRKQDIASIDIDAEKSLMPSYDDAFNNREIDDLIAFLTGLK